MELARAAGANGTAVLALIPSSIAAQGGKRIGIGSVGKVGLQKVHIVRATRHLLSKMTTDFD